MLALGEGCPASGSSSCPVMNGGRVLVVEDDAELRRVLARALEDEGFTVVAVATGSAALSQDLSALDALVLDVGLPDSDGRDVCQAVRARGCGAPVLFLTARDALSDRLSGFSAGGDDYLTKPFHLSELVARLNALLRRGSLDTSLTVGDMRLDPVAHELTGPHGSASLTPTEFRLLAALAGRPGAVLRRRELAAAAWPDGAIVHANTLDQYLVRLRRKLRDVAPDCVITTVHGVGYRLT
jgi:two-component system response regulator MprA